MKTPEINLYYCTSCGVVQVKNETLESGEDSFTSICQVCNRCTHHIQTRSSRPEIRLDGLYYEGTRMIQTREEVSQHFATMFEEIMVTREAGQKEYAHDDNKAFANFEKLSEELGIPREKVLWIYAMKHKDGIVSYLKGHKSQRESVHGRIKDLIVYLMLLDGMITDNESSTAIVDSRRRG